jgi:hypothetical protein
VRDILAIGGVGESVCSARFKTMMGDEFVQEGEGGSSCHSGQSEFRFGCHAIGCCLVHRWLGSQRCRARTVIFQMELPQVEGLTGAPVEDNAGELKRVRAADRKKMD